MIGLSELLSKQKCSVKRTTLTELFADDYEMSEIPRIVHQLKVMNHCLQGYFTDKWTWQRGKKSMTRREKKEKNAGSNEKNERRGKPTKEHASTKLLKRWNILMVPTPTDVSHG